jgi:hypothetical protein
VRNIFGWHAYIQSMTSSTSFYWDSHLSETTYLFKCQCYLLKLL